MASAPTYPRFSFGKTISDTFAAIGRSFGAIVALTAIAFLVYLLLSAALGVAIVGSMFGGGGYDPTGIATAVFMPLLVMLVAIAVAYMLEISIVRLALRRIGAGGGGLGDSLATALRKIVPVLVVAILGWIILIVIMIAGVFVYSVFITILGLRTESAAAVLLALIFFPLAAAPAIYVALGLIAQVPAYLAEDIGVFASFGRSWSLTRGARWKLLALCLLYLVSLFLMMGVMLLVVAATVGLGVGSLTSGMTPQVGLGAAGIGLMIFFTLAQFVFWVINAMFAYVGLAAIYANLRESKEGVNQDRIADVFG